MGPIGGPAPRRTGRQIVYLALELASLHCKLQTRPLVREGAPHQQTRSCLKIIKERREKIGRGCLTPRQTGRLTVGRNITLI
jgi:hypothetical protein